MLKYTTLCRLATRPIVPGLHLQLFPNEFVNYSLAWDGLEVIFIELFRTTMEVFMIFYLKMVILNNGSKTNTIRMLPMHAYPSATLDLGL